MWVCDLGNTRLHWAWREAGELRRRDAALWRDQAYQAVWRPGESEVVVVSVAADTVEQTLQAWLRDQGATTVRFPRSRRRQGGVTNAYRDVTQLGADRWAAMVAAHARHTGPLAIIDCGSAISVDILDRDGRHCGGAILPGLGMMDAALTQTTARIASGDIGVAPDLGASTSECVSAGVRDAAVGGVHRVLDAARRKLGATPRRILCGGDASRLRPYLEPVTPDPDLVLWGAVLLAKHDAERVS